jgi:hypothetical protein
MVRAAQTPTPPLAITPRKEREMPCLPSGGDVSADFILPEDMDWIANLRDVDTVLGSLRERIRNTKTVSEQDKTAKWCGEISEVFWLMKQAAQSASDEHKRSL